MFRRAPIAPIALSLALAGCAGPIDHDWVRRGPSQACAARPDFTAAARLNAGDLDVLVWSPFGAPELGWRTYAPAIAAEVGARCTPDSTEFAARLARWQARRGLAGDGRLTPAVFEAMKAGWQGRRPFYVLRQQDICPDAPLEASLTPAPARDSTLGKTVLLEPRAQAAFVRMRTAARRALDIEDGDETLAVFSGYRSPDYDAERCAREQNCQGVVRAQCSSHRTGLALDLVLGPAPGYAVDASAGPNRLYQSQTPAYRWLVANARRYGFANYVFEPWHWEWAGARR